MVDVVILGFVVTFSFNGVLFFNQALTVVRVLSEKNVKVQVAVVKLLFECLNFLLYRFYGSSAHLHVNLVK